MDRYSDIRRALREICKTEGNYIFTAEVDSVSGQSCDVMVGSMKISEVRLCSVDDGESGNLMIVPKVGSKVLVMDMSGGDMRDLVIVKVSQTESIVINGGKLGGLIKIEELTKKINDLVKTFNNHTHTVKTTGSSSAQSGVSDVPMSKMQSLSKGDYEDERVKH